MHDLALHEALGAVIEAVTEHGRRGAPERMAAAAAIGRRLAEAIHADRDSPAWPRAQRDGYALRATDEGPRRPIDIVRAGAASAMAVGQGECAEIMTGAPVPAGADAVAMVEHTRREAGGVVLTSPVEAGENIAPRGIEYRAGAALLAAGTRLDYSVLALLATVGCGRPLVYPAPRVAILATGDELVEPFAEAELGTARIRNSNALALAAQVERAGGQPTVLPTGRDEPHQLGGLIERGWAEADLLVISGGVSKGKFDFVKAALSERGAASVFDSVRIRPGRPVTFGHAGGKFFFGLPGNPLSAMLTFELFARPAIEWTAGAEPGQVARPWLAAELGFDYRGRALPLAFFLPVRWIGGPGRARVEAVPYHGSADIAALASADGYLLVPEGCTALEAGSIVNIWPK